MSLTIDKAITVEAAATGRCDETRETKGLTALLYTERATGERFLVVTDPRSHAPLRGGAEGAADGPDEPGDEGHDDGPPWTWVTYGRRGDKVVRALAEQGMELPLRHIGEGAATIQQRRM
jgi:hypothetical protein